MTIQSLSDVDYDYELYMMQPVSGDEILTLNVCFFVCWSDLEYEVCIVQPISGPLTLLAI